MNPAKPGLQRPPVIRPRIDPVEVEAKARAFIQGAEDNQRGDQPPVATPAPAPEPAYPWLSPLVRKDIVKVFNLRVPEPTKLKLQWLAESSPKSMHQIALDAVEAEVERMVRERTRQA